MPKLNGRKIAWLRGQRGWSKEHAAGAAEISREEWIRRVERYKNVSGEVAQKVASAFDVTVGEILAEWEVKEYRVFAKIEPRESVLFKKEIGYQERRKMSVTTDNWARVTKTVEFSPSGGRTDPFLLQYRTRGGGLVFVLNDYDVCNPERNAFLSGPPHRWRAYYDNGNDVTYECNTRYPSVQTLDVEVYKGYDASHRNLTCYLPEETHYESVRLTLDLTAYLGKQYSVRLSPRLVFFGLDTHRAAYQIPEQHASETEAIVPELNDDWHRTWVIPNPRPGVMHLVWDLAAPDYSASRTHSAKS